MHHQEFTIACGGTNTRANNGHVNHNGTPYPPSPSFKSLCHCHMQQHPHHHLSSKARSRFARSDHRVNHTALPTSWLDGLVNGGSQHQVPVRGLGTGEHQASQLGQSTTQGGGEHHVAAIGGDLQSSHNNDVDSVTDQKKTPPNKVSTWGRTSLLSQQIALSCPDVLCGLWEQTNESVRITWAAWHVVAGGGAHQ